MRQHPEMGERILDQVEFLKGAKLHIRHHHERFEGIGHPDGLSGEDIPLGARIIAFAEAFDCITSDCTFQPKRSIEDAIDEIQKYAGTQFDPRIIGIFVESVVSRLRDGDLEQITVSYESLLPLLIVRHNSTLSILPLPIAQSSKT